MASLLYRLGRFSARHAWSVLIAWLLILGLAGAGAATLKTPFTSKLSIPGTEFQQVLDDLQTALPDAAHGSAPVVFSTTDGKPFTDAQKDRIAGTVATWKGITNVSNVTSPFELQQQLDDAKAQVTTGAQQLADGKQQIIDNQMKIASGEGALVGAEVTVLVNQAALDSGQQQLDAAKAKLATGQQQVTSNAAKLTSGQQQIASNQAKLTAGQQQVDANAAKLTAGRQQLDTQQAQLTAGQQQLDAGKAQLAAQQKELDAQSAQVDQLAAQLGPDDPQVSAARAKIAAGQQQLDAASAQLNSKQAQVTSGQQQLDAAKAQLASGQQQLNAAKAQLASGQSQLNAAKAQLASGQSQLNAGKAKVASGQQEIATNQAKITAGRQQLDEARATIATKSQELIDGQKQLDEATAKLPDQEAQLLQGQRRVALIDGMRTVSASGAAAVTTVSFGTSMQEVTTATKSQVIDAGNALSDAGVKVSYSSDLTQELNFAGPTEAIGLLIAGVVLLVMLGSLLAAGLPILTALVGVGVGLLGTVAVTHWVSMSNVTPVLALMLGLAVGIDYALFIVNRHRRELARGHDLVDSIALATGTAGSAVLFAGMTVLVALAALTLSGIPFLGTMGLAAAATVAISVVVAVTLTPALLRFIGHRVLPRKARAQLLEQAAASEQEAAAEDAEQSMASPRSRHSISGHGWVARVTRHPVVTLLAATVFLGLLAIPAASLKLGLPDGGSEPSSSTAYQSYTTIADQFGPGQNATVLAEAKVPADRAAQLSDAQLTNLELDVAEQLKAEQGVAYVVPIGASSDHRTLVFQVVPTTGPSDDATVELIHRLRDSRSGIISATGITSMGFAGQTVANIDISERLGSTLPSYLAVVVGISLVLLLLVFRSVLVPIVATAGFLLSIAAAFGAVVAVYQWGWLGSIFGVEHPGLILSFLPILVIGILFGLAMDYQMFLVSGMRESWAHGHAARTAVQSGFHQGSRVVTAAALIMTSVFASFVHSGMTMVRPIGFALASGVLIDAFVVRMTAIPAVMHLLGERAWWIPRWLDRILPDLDVEGTKLEHEVAPAGAEGSSVEEEPGSHAGSGSEDDYAGLVTRS